MRSFHFHALAAAAMLARLSGVFIADAARGPAAGAAPGAAGTFGAGTSSGGTGTSSGGTGTSSGGTGGGMRGGPVRNGGAAPDAPYVGAVEATSLAALSGQA
jgi:hypothetical protein